MGTDAHEEVVHGVHIGALAGAEAHVVEPDAELLRSRGVRQVHEFIRASRGGRALTGGGGRTAVGIVSAEDPWRNECFSQIGCGFQGWGGSGLFDTLSFLIEAANRAETRVQSGVRAIGLGSS